MYKYTRRIYVSVHGSYQSQWPSGQRRESADARLRGLLVRIPLRGWMSVVCECFLLSGRGILRRADPSSRVVLPTVLCHCV